MAPHVPRCRPSPCPRPAPPPRPPPAPPSPPFWGGSGKDGAAGCRSTGRREMAPQTRHRSVGVPVPGPRLHRAPCPQRHRGAGGGGGRTFAPGDRAAEPHPNGGMQPVPASDRDDVGLSRVQRYGAPPCSGPPESRLWLRPQPRLGPDSAGRRCGGPP